MSDENLPQESGFPETPENEPNQNNTTEELEQVRSRVIELEALVAQKDEELAKTNARVSELELVAAESNRKLAQAVSSYKALVVQANPGVLEELISGDSIEEINESMERTKTLISRVKQELEVEVSRTKIPAGAPERTPPDLSALSPSEKIQYAIGGRK